MAYREGRGGWRSVGTAAGLYEGKVAGVSVLTCQALLGEGPSGILLYQFHVQLMCSGGVGKSP